ncbi:MAG: alpha/beta hydrolase family protein [Acidobacteriaceae bacterium]
MLFTFLRSCVCGCMLLASLAITAQQVQSSDSKTEPAVNRYMLDETNKAIDDLAWQNKVGDIANIEKIVYTGLPDRHLKPASAQYGQPMLLYAYTFIPKSLDRARKHPLIVFIHGGVHGSMLSGGPDNSARIVRELLKRGYPIIAPEYRGSSGYGEEYENAMDYGATENDDVVRARNWMVQRYSFIDASRVGLVGWSHGGMIALMNLFQHPDLFACGFAGVPVSDLTARMTYVTKTYRRSMAASIGEDLDQDRAEYLRRSPVSYAAQLKRPLLLEANTSDPTVRFIEIQHLLAALNSTHRKFVSHIYHDAPGGHFFNRIDTKLAVDSRNQIYEFLGGYLKP